jgi:hypothetical protein
VLRLVLLALAAAAVTWLPAAAGGGARELLPDLDQRAPYAIGVAIAGTREEPRYRLVFGSAVDNVGEGPLVVAGSRPSRAVRTMRAAQLVRRSDGTARRVEDVGLLRFVVSADHRHWHFLLFDRYELRTLDGELLVRDRKTGFCLGDRYRAREGAGDAVWTGRCGIDKPGLLVIREGITPGFGDNYHPNLEGQYLDVTGLSAGRYLLVHRVNETRALVESDYSNNASSAVIELRRSGGAGGPPAVTRLALCPDSDRCAPA